MKSGTNQNQLPDNPGSNPLKCIIVGPAYPLRGGIANFNEALCKTLIKIGLDCRIISFSLQYPAILFPGKTQLEEGGDIPDLPVISLINSINPVSWFKTALYIKKEKPDFVIVRYWLPFMAPCLGTIARLINSKTRVIAITDNIIPHEKRTGDHFLTRYFVNSCHAYIAMSKSVLDDLSLFTISKNKFFTPHPVYNIFGNAIEKAEARKHLGLEESGKYILFFGFIRKYKGLDLLIEAISNPYVVAENVHLIIAGEFYEDENDYLELINKYGISKQVILKTTYIPREEVKFYFSAVDMVVQPYRQATQSGITQIAYHFNKPMLVTRVGGLPEIVKDGFVGYVTDLDPGAISTAILDFYQQKREEEFVANVKTEKENFTWEAFAGKLLSVYSIIQTQN